LHADLLEIRGAAERSAELTKQLLAFARKQTVAPCLIDLNQAIERTIKLLSRLIGEEIALSWRPGLDIWPVRMDPSQVDQILTNLCINAKDAIAGLGAISIETANCALDESRRDDFPDFIPGQYVELKVTDDGCGMDASMLEKLFEPFFTTKEAGKGTGLGLAMVYGIVKQNAGYIYVESAPGNGASFKIYLPRYSGLPEQRASATSMTGGGRGREIILLVEDEPAILRLAARILEKQGYAVMAASTPGEAMRLSREHSGEIDLLITDVVMPEMNGRDLAKNLLSIYPNLKRLFMSGYTADVIAHHGVLDEGVNFLQKPFNINELTKKIREILDKG
jgi:CheY-like chemotaxis protein